MDAKAKISLGTYTLTIIFDARALVEVATL